MTGKRLPTSVNFMMHIEFFRHTHDTWMASHQFEFYGESETNQIAIAYSLLRTSRYKRDRQTAPTSVNFMMNIELSRYTHDTWMTFRQREFYEDQWNCYRA